VPTNQRKGVAAVTATPFLLKNFSLY
jgi:hypothetical protein